MQALFTAQDHLGSLATDLLGELLLTAERRLRMHLDQTVAAHQHHPPTFAEAEVVDQFGEFGHTQAKPGDTHQLPGFLHPIVDEQCQFAGAAVGVDVQQARVATVDKAEKPLVRRVAAAEGAVQAFLVVIVVARCSGKQRGKGMVLFAQGFEVLDKLRRLGAVFPCRQPIAQQRVVGNVGRRRQRSAKHALDVVTNRLNARRQGGVDQVTLGQAIDRHAIDADHDQNAQQQRCAHACDQLPLDTAPPELHVFPLGK
ncbi:hypothetical protein D3C78_533040 [compost metagenome]